MPFRNDDICGMVQVLQLQDHSSPTYIPVPITSVNLQVRVVNFITQVEVHQMFVNKEAGPIECVYFFPVEEEAAVIDFTAELEGKIIKTEVKEKEKARDEYRTAVEGRQTAFLLEETKPDIFEIKIGHLSPGAACKICITYMCELPVEEGKTRLTIPTTVAPRYTPPSDTSEEGRKIATVQHDFKSPVKMTMNMEVVMKSEIIQVKSPSHSLGDPKKEQKGEYFHAILDFDGNTTDMDRDLVVLIETEEPNTPKIVFEKNNSGSEVAMLSFVPQFKLKEHQVEAVFLVDCSGSMRGQSMNLAKEALEVFLHSLPVTSCFNIILFGSTFKSMFSVSKTYDDDTLKEAKMFVQNISADLGGTEIHQPLEHIFNLELQIVDGSKRPRQVFVLTDGQVSNSTACIKLVKKNSHTNRVFTLGIGASADRHLVKGMARAGQGTAAFTTEGEPITSKVISQLKNALQPCISDVKIQWGKEANVADLSEYKDKEIETKRTLLGFGKPKKSKIPQEKIRDLSLKHQTPRNISAIYDGSRLLVYKLVDKTLKMEDMITVKAATPEGELELSMPVNLDSFIEGDAVHKLFARKKIQEVEEMLEQEESSEKKKFITELGLKFKLASKYTSFVGVDAKKNKQSGFMMTRHIKNQLPHNSGHAGFEAYRSMTKSAGPKKTRSMLRSVKAKSVSQNEAGGFQSARRPHKSASLDQVDAMSPPGAPPPSRSRSIMCTDSASSVQNYGPDEDDMRFIGEKLRGGTDSTESRHRHSSVQNDGPDEDDMRFIGAKMRGGTKPKSKEGSKESKSNENKVLSLTSCQEANGSFLSGVKMAATLGVSVDLLLTEGRKVLHDVPEADQEALLDAWTTAVVVTFLRELCQKEKEVWELVVDKADRWLQKYATNFSEAHMKKANEFVTLNMSHN